ncbi:universal stress protein [Kitasatospora herbaricolor]|uniref:universal stress protein n=1 Tax=Kitasatospora herbaricolor TaxID=68217 RepID=UPI00174A39C9|nr:universal stress protein [Kitasatospora herbaricolor]MDQ0312696.1 nucleotide-binding universal stress UspA family protein [Kitasatospora herbaricolor]GGV35173.1 universal stress protein [Kitasatospora herbaricolor]
MGTTSENTHPVIVVGVDGSPSSRAALRWAQGQARLEDASVEAVAAWDYPPMSGWGLSVPGPEIEEAARLALADTVKQEQAPARPPVRQRTECGHPADVLLRAARGAHLLVVGSRGLGGFTGTLLGSVSRHCVEHAPCPVVVVRGTGS